MIANVTSHKLRENNPACMQACTQEIRANVLLLKAFENFIYKHSSFRKCTKVLETRENLKDFMLAQTRCQKLSITTMNPL